MNQVSSAKAIAESRVCLITAMHATNAAQQAKGAPEVTPSQPARRIAQAASSTAGPRRARARAPP